MTGLVLIVGARDAVAAELEPILLRGPHRSHRAPSAAAALRLLDAGFVPDVVITDGGCDGDTDEYLWRFRELNCTGRHLCVVEGGPPPHERALPLRRPFDVDEVLAVVDQAVRRVDAELFAQRQDLWRERGAMRRAVEDLQAQLVLALGAAISARDPFMRGHSERVAGLAVRVAEAAGLPVAQVELLRTAAELHEIGKIAVPLELLHKRNPLEEAELVQIRAHAQLGAEILRSVPALRSAAAVVEHQHTDFTELALFFEPDGAEIFLAGALRAADVYDSILSPRSYRDALDWSEAAGVLTRGAGTRFHPECVELLLHLSGPRATRAA